MLSQRYSTELYLWLSREQRQRLKGRCVFVYVREKKWSGKTEFIHSNAKTYYTTLTGKTLFLNELKTNGKRRIKLMGGKCKIQNVN